MTSVDGHWTDDWPWGLPVIDIWPWESPNLWEFYCIIVSAVLTLWCCCVRLWLDYEGAGQELGNYLQVFSQSWCSEAEWSYPCRIACHGRGSSEALRLQIEVPSPSPWLLNPIYQLTPRVRDMYEWCLDLCYNTQIIVSTTKSMWQSWVEKNFVPCVYAQGVIGRVIVVPIVCCCGHKNRLIWRSERLSITNWKTGLQTHETSQILHFS